MMGFGSVPGPTRDFPELADKTGPRIAVRGRAIEHPERTAR